jgi:predicted transcriptional regulator
MEFKGTKGKWVLKTFPEGQISVRNESDTRKICVPRVQNYEESLANLLLISKAPEMLEMLEIFESYFVGKQIDEYEYQLKLDLKQLIKESTEI